MANELFQEYWIWRQIRSPEFSSMVIIYFFLLKVQSRIDLGMFECRERFYATSGVSFFHFSAIFLNKKKKVSNGIGF
jgi:hypothetical protein